MTDRYYVGTDPVDPGLGKSAFGDTIAVRKKPVAGIRATYGILTDAETFTASGGSVAATDNNFVLQTGTTVGGYGVIWQRQPVVYQQGVGVEAVGTAMFTAGVASSQQGWGLFSTNDGMFFGYDGTTFGLMHRYGGKVEIRTISVTASATGAETVTVTLNGTAYTASVTNTTATNNAHEITAALEAGAANSLWKFQHIGTTVVCTYRGNGAKSGTYSVTSTGTLTATVAQTAAGVAATENWTARTSWNVDKATWLDPTKGNIYRVSFAHLGYGPLTWEVFNPSTNKFVVVHRIAWSNAYTTPNFGNASMSAGWFSASLGSTTNLTVKGCNTATFLQGDRFDGRHFGASGAATGVTTETQVLTVQVRNEFGGRVNNGVLVPTLATLSTDSTKGAIFRFLRNPTVSGNTAHAYVDQTESVAITDTAGTTVSGGRVLAVVSVGPSGRTTVDLDRINALLIAGDELVITARVVSGAASDMSAAVSWEEIV